MPPRPTPAPSDRATEPIGRRGRLRGLVGGYDIERWPITVPIGPGEHVASWLARLAHRYDVAPSKLLEVAGASLTSHSPSRLLTQLDQRGPVLERLLDLPEGAVTAAATVPLTAARVAYMRAYRQRRPVPVTVACRFCPSCLAQDEGRWAAAWSEPLHLACPRHGVYLQARCPGCGQVPRSSGTWMTTSAPPWQCPQRHERATGQGPRTRAPWCEMDLREVPESLPAPAVLLGAQQLLLDLASVPREEGVVCAGIQTGAGECVEAFLELVTEYAAGAGTPVALETCPDRLAAAVTAAHRVLSAPSLVAAAAIADAHGLLDVAGDLTPVGQPPARVRRRAHNPVLVAVRLASLAEQLAPASQLMYRTASDRPRYPASLLPLDPVAAGGRADHTEPQAHASGLALIPQVLWPGCLAEHAAVAGPHGRVALAMGLAKIGSLASWRTIAVELDLPGWVAGHLRHCWDRLRRPDRWKSVMADLEDLYQRLQTTPPAIDYRDRRQVADDHAFLAECISVACRVVVEPAGGDECDLLRRFYEIFTGGDIRYAPAPLTITDSEHYAAYRALTAGLAHDDPVMAHTFELTHTSGRVSGPLHWQPPRTHPADNAQPSPPEPMLTSRDRPYSRRDDEHQLIVAALTAAEHRLSPGEITRWLPGHLERRYGTCTEHARENWPAVITALSKIATGGWHHDDAIHAVPPLHRSLARDCAPRLGYGQRHNADWHNLLPDDEPQHPG